MLIRDARPGDLEALLNLLNEDAIREVSEDYSDLTPYADALAEIVGAAHSTVLVGESVRSLRIDGATDLEPNSSSGSSLMLGNAVARASS